METKAGDAGAFAHFDLSRVDSPAFVVDKATIERNLGILADIKNRAGIKMLAALKAFSFWPLGEFTGQYLDGTCTSGLWEARLAQKYYPGEITTYCAGYKAADMPEIIAISDHLIFNSPGQYRRFLAMVVDARAKGKEISLGLRINPELPLGETAKYDPSQPCSRLGFPISQLTAEHLQGIDGLHVHNLCEQDVEPFQLVIMWC